VVTDQAAQQAVVEELLKKGIRVKKSPGLAGVTVAGARRTVMGESRPF